MKWKLIAIEDPDSKYNKFFTYCLNINYALLVYRTGKITYNRLTTD